MPLPRDVLDPLVLPLLVVDVPDFFVAVFFFAVLVDALDIEPDGVPLLGVVWPEPVCDVPPDIEPLDEPDFVPVALPLLGVVCPEPLCVVCALAAAAVADMARISAAV